MYKRYFIEDSSGFTSTFEFFIRNGKLYCEYNGNKARPFIEYLNKSYYPEVRMLLRKICEWIVKKYNHFDSVQSWIKDRKRWEEIIVNFIEKYFAKYNDPLDVIVKANGTVVMNLEESKMKECFRITNNSKELY